MNFLKLVFILAITFILSSCATIISVKHPDITRDEYAGLLASGSERTKCYERGFRGGMLVLDVLFGIWPAIVDAAGGKFTAYYYHHRRCEQLKAEERSARISRESRISREYYGDEYNDTYGEEYRPVQKRTHPTKGRNLEYEDDAYYDRDPAFEESPYEEPSYEEPVEPSRSSKSQHSLSRSKQKVRQQTPQNNSRATSDDDEYDVLY